jgi:hypothetical protein
VGSVGHVVLSGASGPRNIDKLIFMLGWDRYQFDKKRIGTCSAEFVFCTNGIWRSQSTFQCIWGTKHRCNIFSCSGGTGNYCTKSAPEIVTPNMCFRMWWDMRVTECIPMHLRRETSMHYFHARMGLIRIPQKVHRDTLRRTCVFTSDGICGTCSPFRCVRGMKY